MAGNPTLNRMIRQTLYSLKMRYGAKATVYKLNSAATDYRTGLKTADYISIDVEKCIVMPASEVRRFFASVSFISASKSFLSPGQQGWDQGQRGFIFDARDIPGYEFEPEHWIVYRGDRYEVSMIERLEFDTGWLVIAKETKGQRPEQDIRLNVVDTLNITQDETEVVE